jgi:uncharacterized membrane protein YadS
MLEGKSPSHSQRAKFVNLLQRYLPGILLCVTIMLAATLLQAIEVKLVGQPYLEALVLAILIGVAIRTTWTRAWVGFPELFSVQNSFSNSQLFCLALR